MHCLSIEYSIYFKYVVFFYKSLQWCDLLLSSTTWRFPKGAADVSPKGIGQNKSLLRNSLEGQDNNKKTQTSQRHDFGRHLQPPMRLDWKPHVLCVDVLYTRGVLSSALYVTRLLGTATDIRPGACFMKITSLAIPTILQICQ